MRRDDAVMRPSRACSSQIAAENRVVGVDPAVPQEGPVAARLPDQREIANLLSSIASSARGVGLDITLFRQQPETYADFYAQVPVEMKMRGTYHDVAMFLDRVKRMDRIVNVSDIRLEKPAMQGDRMVLDASCTATTFRFLQEAEREALAAEKAKNKDGKDGKDGKATKRPSRRGT